MWITITHFVMIHKVMHSGYCIGMRKEYAQFIWQIFVSSPRMAKSNPAQLSIQTNMHQMFQLINAPPWWHLYHIPRAYRTGTHAHVFICLVNNLQQHIFHHHEICIEMCFYMQIKEWFKLAHAVKIGLITFLQCTWWHYVLYLNNTK